MKGLVLGLVLMARGALGATWTCDNQVEMFVTPAYLVSARCTASGTYTTGGDSFDSVGPALCKSAARRPVAVVNSSAGDLVNDQGYLVLLTTAQKVILLTATGSPGNGLPLGEVSNGTSITGTVMRTLTVCQ